MQHITTPVKRQNENTAEATVLVDISSCIHLKGIDYVKRMDTIQFRWDRRGLKATQTTAVPGQFDFQETT